MEKLIYSCIMFLCILNPSSCTDEPAASDEDDVTASTEKMESSTHKDISDADVYAAVVKLYIQDIKQEVKNECTGVFITQFWMVTTASCLKDTNNESMLKICADSRNINNAEFCTNHTYGYKIVYLRNSWYNNMAFVKTDRSLQKFMPVSWSSGNAPAMEQCRVIGFTDHKEDSLADVLVDMRKSCRRGYYCLDDSAGWACDVDIGSPLICNGTIRGIYSGHHLLSCDDPVPDTDNEDPVEEERWALLFFISFDTYKDVMKEILGDKYFATDD